MSTYDTLLADKIEVAELVADSVGRLADMLAQADAADSEQLNIAIGACQLAADLASNTWLAYQYCDSPQHSYNSALTSAELACDKLTQYQSAVYRLLLLARRQGNAALDTAHTLAHDTVSYAVSLCIALEYEIRHSA